MSEGLYIPGLGEGRMYEAQRRYIALVNRRRTTDNKIDFFDARWQTNESYEAKMFRLLSYTPRRVYASSAGASLAVSLAAVHREIEVAHLFCGKVTGSEKVGEDYQAQAPALLEAVQRSEAAIEDGVDPARFICYIPRGENDGILETADMDVPGARIVQMPKLKHAYAIGYALTRYLPRR